MKAVTLTNPIWCPHWGWFHCNFVIVLVFPERMGMWPWQLNNVLLHSDTLQDCDRQIFKDRALQCVARKKATGGNSKRSRLIAMVMFTLYNRPTDWFLAVAKQAVHSRRTVPRSTHLHHCNSWVYEVRQYGYSCFIDADRVLTVLVLTLLSTMQG